MTPDLDLELDLEYGKRYVRRDGEISDPLIPREKGYSGEYPFHDPKFDDSYTRHGAYDLGGPSRYDLVSEYIAPVGYDFSAIEATSPTETKPSNPKDMIGSTKLPVGLVPDTITAEVTLAFLEGALKYGRYNWRIAGVRASIYNDALERHRKKWWNGENADQKTRVKHLSSIIACAGILLDAELCGMLNDDRPPYAPMSDLMDSPETLERIAHLKELFKDHNPRQFTIADKPAPEAP